MKKYLVEKYKVNSDNINYQLYDTQWYAFESSFTSIHRDICYNEEKQECYIEFWYVNLEEENEWPRCKIEYLDIIEEFDTLEEVKEKYILTEEPHEMPYEGDISYIDPILIIKK